MPWRFKRPIHFRAVHSLQPSLSAISRGEAPVGEQDYLRPPRPAGRDLAASHRLLEDPVLVGVRHLHALDRSHRVDTPPSSPATLDAGPPAYRIVVVRPCLPYGRRPPACALAV